MFLVRRSRLMLVLGLVLSSGPPGRLVIVIYTPSPEITKCCRTLRMAGRLAVRLIISPSLSPAPQRRLVHF